MALFAAFALVVSLCLCLSNGVAEYNVACWGGNSKGQLGVGEAFDYSLPRYLNMDLFEGEIVQISMGLDFSLALDSLGNVYTWGANDRCQNGYETSESEINEEIGAVNFEPKKLKLSKKVTYISAGGEHAFAIVDDNNVYVWGANEYSQAKPGSDQDVCQPELINFSTYLEPGEHIMKIVGGRSSSYILTMTGQVYSWGSNKVGQLGLCDIADVNNKYANGSSVPVHVEIDVGNNANCSVVNSIHAGQDYVHVTCENNTKLIGWGNNEYFLIDGVSPDGPFNVGKPFFIGPRPDDTWTLPFTSISGVKEHAVMLSGKRLVCWGSSENGECGYVQDFIKTPTIKKGQYDISDLATAGDNFTILYKEPIIYASGNNQSYQLGTASIEPGGHTDAFVEVYIEGLDPKPRYNPHIISSGNYHTCVLFGEYVPPEKEPLSFVDVYVYFLLADAIISFIYFVTIGIMECVKR